VTNAQESNPKTKQLLQSKDAKTFAKHSRCLLFLVSDGIKARVACEPLYNAFQRWQQQRPT
jgi:hypothetical protein